MRFIDHWLVTILLLVPAAGALAVLIVGRPAAVRWTAIGVAAVSLLLSLAILSRIHLHGGTGHLSSQGKQMSSINGSGSAQDTAGHDRVTIDQFSGPFVLLTALICLAACVLSGQVERRCSLYFSLLLLFETTTLGSFVAFDLPLFWCFLLLSIVPASLLLGLWGRSRARRAATRLFVYLLVSSACLLVSVVGIHVANPLPQISAPATILFGLAVVGLLIRLAAAPVHTWLPDTIAQASPPVGIVLGVLVPATGGYGLFRFALPLFPPAARSLSPVLATLGIISVVYGGLCAIGQRNCRRVVGYGSVSLLGFGLMGAAIATPAAANAAVFVLLSHGLILSVALMVIGDQSSPASVTARYAPIAWFVYLVLPGLMAQSAILLAVFQAVGFDGAGGATITTMGALASACGLAGALGIVLTAAYMIRFLRTYARVDASPKLRA